MSKRLRHNKSGFTMIELMIATSVFAVILLVITVGIMSFTNSYYKGITSNNTQNVARSIVNTIGQAIQFSGSDYIQLNPYPSTSNPVWQGFCLGNTAFIYKLGQQLVDSGHSLGTNQTHQALLKVNVPGCVNQSISSLQAESASNKIEMLNLNMRLANLVVTQLSNNLYKVQIRVAYGDNDLLDNPTGTNAKCKNGTGSQFCAASELSTVVQKRVP